VRRTRLDHVVVGAGIEPGNDILGRVAGGQDKHGQGVATGAQAFEYFKAGQARQTEVENQRGERLAGQRMARGESVADQIGLPAGLTQAHLDAFTKQAVVLDNKNAHSYLPHCQKNRSANQRQYGQRHAPV
jgi:hypothetical protein